MVIAVSAVLYNCCPSRDFFITIIGFIVVWVNKRMYVCIYVCVHALIELITWWLIYFCYSICHLFVVIKMQCHLSLYVTASAKNIRFQRFCCTANLRPVSVSQLLSQSRCCTSKFVRYLPSSSSSSSSSSAASDSERTVNSSSKSAQSASNATLPTPSQQSTGPGKMESAKLGISKPPKDAVSEIVYKG